MPDRTRRRSLRKRIGLGLGIFAAIAIFVGIHGYQEALRDPIVRTATLVEPDWPAGSPDMRILLMADLHVQGPTMSPSRLQHIVDEVNALHPDVIVLAGDFSPSDPFATKTYRIQDAVEPLRSLRPRLVTLAVLGNHDRGDSDQVRGTLESVGVRVLEDDAIQVGPVAIAGVHRRLPPALRRLRQLHGMKILVAHAPDQFNRLPSRVSLMLAGHTHCGQIVLPLVGALSTGSRFGTRYMCGLVRESGKTLIVTAGLGTSRLPIRLGAPPDVWLIRIRGPQKSFEVH